MLEQVKKFYYQFPDRSNFIPVNQIDEETVEFYYSDEEGLNKAVFLNFLTNTKGKYKKVDKNEILNLLEQDFDTTIEEEVGSEVENLDDENLNILAVSFEDAPIIKLVNNILINAVRYNASDIHFEGRDNIFEVRLRIDGKLQVFKKFPKNIQEPIIARIKVMSDLDVAETRKPQDGRINLKVGTKNVDIRVSVVPSVTGEKAVLRILEKSKNLLTLDKIGMPEKFMKIYRHYLKSPNGIILVTGPTGSGKTTTLYAGILEISSDDINIMTIEDPVEYKIEKVTQVQVNQAVNITFANAIRSFLRQDPDVILVGEIRDEETASAAIQASLTGHLVLSTLHTNDAPTAVARLIDMNIEPFLISSSLMLVIAQRLVRKICPHCKEKVEVSEEINEFFEKSGKKLEYYYKGKGCEHCFGTGYRGRTGIFEFLEIDDNIRRLINKKASADVIKREALKSSYRTMFDHGFELITEGITTAEEVIAATKIE